jgi:hypothetical protein
MNLDLIILVIAYLGVVTDAVSDVQDARCKGMDIVDGPDFLMAW